MDKRTKRFAIGAIVAAGVGYVAGILTAPKSGKETRKDIHDTAVKARSEAEKRLKSLYGELNDLLAQAKSQAGKLSATAKAQLAAAVKSAQKSKDKAKNILSAVHEGDAEDEDLQAAIDEVNEAVEHLKSYLKKDV